MLEQGVNRFRRSVTGCIRGSLSQNWSAGGPMTRTWTIIGVSDVPASFGWYQTLLGQPAGPPAHDYFGQILDSDGTVLLCLHEWGAHEHPSLMSPDHGIPGNGLLLFFRVDDFRPGASKGTLSRPWARRGSAREPEHSNRGVLAPGSGRILRYDQCALCGLKGDIFSRSPAVLKPRSRGGHTDLG